MANVHVALAFSAALLLGGCLLPTFEREPGPPPPEIPEAFERGLDRYQRGLYQEAIDDFTLAIEERSDWAPVYVMRGNAHQKIIDTRDRVWTERQYLERAVMDYSRAIMLSPALPEPWFHRALAYLGMRMYDLAASDLLQLTTSVSVNNADPHRILGYLYEEKFEGMELEAIKHYLAYIRKGGTDPQILERMQGLESLTDSGVKPKESEDVRERRARELFGEYGEAVMLQRNNAAIQALELLLANYGDTQFVSEKKEAFDKMLERLKKKEE